MLFEAKPMRVIANLSRSQLPRASVGRPWTLRVVQQSRSLCHTSGRPHSRRDESKPSPGLALDSDDFNSLVHRRCYMLDHFYILGRLTHVTGLFFQWRPSFLPLLEMLGGIDSATDMALGSYAPVLCKSRRAGFGRLVYPLLAPDLVRAAITLKSAVARVDAVVD